MSQHSPAAHSARGYARSWQPTQHALAASHSSPSSTTPLPHEAVVVMHEPAALHTPALPPWEHAVPASKKRPVSAPQPPPEVNLQRGEHGEPVDGLHVAVSDSTFEASAHTGVSV